MRRLQVLLPDDELAEIQEIARRNRVTTAAWVRAALRHARDYGTQREAQHKLRAIREGAAHAFPTADIEAMLLEIDRGYAVDGPE